MKNGSMNIWNDLEEDLTPPVEWLLQNARAGGHYSPEILAEALVAGHWFEVFGLAEMMLGDPALARRAAIRALGLAVHEAYRYPAALGVQVWLAGLVLEEVRRASPPDDPSNFEELAVAALAERYGWTAKEIGQIPGLAQAAATTYPSAHLKEEKSSVRAVGLPLTEGELNQLSQAVAVYADGLTARRRLKGRFQETLLILTAIVAVGGMIFGANRLLPPEEDAPQPGFPVFNTPTPLFKRSLERSATQTPLWQEHVAYVVRRGDTLERIAARSGMTVADLMRVNRLTLEEPVYPGQPLWVTVPEYSVGGSPQTGWPEVSGPVELETQIPFSAASDPGWFEPSSTAYIWKPGEVFRILQAVAINWKTLWVDYQLAYYGPLTYDSEPRAYRFQVWVSRPGRSLEISNTLDSPPQIRQIVLNGRAYTSAVGYSGSYQDPDWVHPPQILVTNPMLREMIFPNQSRLAQGSAEIEILGPEIIIGRKTVVSEWHFPDADQILRLWMDVEWGVILRRQQLQTGTGVLISDLIATAIVFNADIPEELFNPLEPWGGGFATGSSGERPRLEDLAPTPTWALPTARPPQE